MKDRVSARRKIHRQFRAGRREVAHGGDAKKLPASPEFRHATMRPALAGAVPDYRELLQACPEAILIQCEGRVAFANRAAQELFRAASGSALIGLQWQRLVAPASWGEAEAHCAIPVAAAYVHVARLELPCQALDGTPFTAESTSVPVVFAGRPALLLSLRDISGRRAAEQELREQRVKLEQLVLERTADLRQALADARLSDQAKDAFLANVSHELRTPLGGIIGLLEIALMRCTDAALRVHLEKAAHAGKHLSRIINDLLDLSKVAAGRIALEAIPFSLGGLLQRVHDVNATEAEARGLRLRFRADGEIPDALVGDPTRIEQILVNLTGNAVKFTHAGDIEVLVSQMTRSEEQIRLSIAVADSGIGMTPEEISGLFQPFSQASAATSRQFGGTGLGLALSQRLAEAMGGRITVSSRKGQGSVFSLGLPLRLSPADGPRLEPEVPAARPPNYDQARVLLVEDDSLSAEIVTELLQAVGIYPRLADNGHEAVALLAEEGPAAYDLVLMDVQMPVLDGHAATRLIRSWKGFDALPIVAMTAHALEHELRAGFAAGMNDQISKPFDHAAFYALLDKWLPWGQGATPAAPGPAPAAPALRCVDVAAALPRFAGNEQRYRQWLARFVDESPAVAPELRRALAAGDRERAVAVAHDFKGSAGTLGLENLQVRAAELEQAIRQGRDAVPELRQLERAIDEARREIIANFGQ